MEVINTHIVKLHQRLDKHHKYYNQLSHDWFIKQLFELFISNP